MLIDNPAAKQQQDQRNQKNINTKDDAKNNRKFELKVRLQRDQTISAYLSFNPIRQTQNKQTSNQQKKVHIIFI